MYEFQTALNQNTFVSLKILEALMQKNLTDEDKAKIIAEGFAELETRYPDLKNVVTKIDLSETELRLIKEIKELDSKLSKEIKELDSKLSKDIKELDSKIADTKLELSKEMKEDKSDMLKWTFTFWITQMIALSGVGFFVYKALSLSN